jgi:hypothetical protein
MLRSSVKTEVACPDAERFYRPVLLKWSNVAYGSGRPNSCYLHQVGGRCSQQRGCCRLLKKGQLHI